VRKGDLGLPLTTVEPPNQDYSGTPVIRTTVEPPNQDTIQSVHISEVSLFQWLSWMPQIEGQFRCPKRVPYSDTVDEAVSCHGANDTLCC
jgi:hypothetical protein